MNKKTLFLLVWFYICASCAYARIGDSVNAFKESTFAHKEGFTFQGSYLITDDPCYEGKYAYNFSPKTTVIGFNL